MMFGKQWSSVRGRREQVMGGVSWPMVASIGLLGSVVAPGAWAGPSQAPVGARGAKPVVKSGGPVAIREVGKGQPAVKAVRQSSPSEGAVARVTRAAVQSAAKIPPAKAQGGRPGARVATGGFCPTPAKL